MTTKREPVVLVMSILAGLQVLTGGAALADVFGAQVAGLLILAVAAAQVGLQFYVRGQVTPVEDAPSSGSGGTSEGLRVLDHDGNTRSTSGGSGRLSRRVYVAGVALTFAILAPLTLLGSPAVASTNQGRACHAVGSTGAWHAAKYVDGNYWGSGPRRWFRTGALGDCRDWLYGF
jgi:hypothetical protein